MMWLYKVICPEFIIMCNKEGWLQCGGGYGEGDTGTWDEGGNSMEAYLKRVSNPALGCKILKLNVKLENK